MTFYVCFGRWGGFHLDFDSAGLRIVLGWVSFAILTFDVELLVNEMKQSLMEKDNENSSTR